MEYYGILMYYIIFINLGTFVIYGVDKEKAIRHQYRISENMLIGLAVIGGSVGAFCGMQVFRHKTKHLKFVIGVPLIFVIQVVLAVFLSQYI